MILIQFRLKTFNYKLNLIIKKRQMIIKMNRYKLTLVKNMIISHNLIKNFLLNNKHPLFKNYNQFKIHN